ncbi:MAG: hypothetical protein KC418_12565 [Anaerolineales bacterium]|nr:hypothetical protein [Anaerolineales bacterium]MCB8951429.1 hypothetical protein [Ardenticatenales bacterium]
MNLLTITGIVVVLTITVGAVLALLSGFASRQVTSVQAEQQLEQSRYNPMLTKGFKIPVNADVEEQIKQARLIAARQAAATPRWGNMKIHGQNATTKAPSAYRGVDNDPLTAVKIAQFHTWSGVLHGPQAAQAVAPGAVTAAPAAVPSKRPEDLVAGVDYPVIEITDSMDPAEVRKARIANSKARSAAVKALKEAGTAAVVPAAPVPGVAPRPVAAPAAASVAAAREPVAGVDYPVIEITDAMSPDEVRKARIANSKARSAAMKAYKAAGGGEAVVAPAAPAPVAAAATPAPVVVVAPTANVPPPPAYIDITDDMDPADVRKARIANSKMRSEYNKALKAAGIDPGTVG